jgi:hypothetical protein
MPKGKVGAVVLMTTGWLLLASPALATAQITIDCDDVTVNFFHFPEGQHEATVEINGVVHQVSWTGSDQVFTFPIEVGFEGGTWIVHAEWEINGAPHQKTVTRTFAEGECAAAPTPSPSPTPTPTPTETTPSPTPTPTPTETTPSPPTETTPPPNIEEAEVKPKTIQEKPSEGRAKVAPSSSLAFTGPRDTVPELGAIAASLFMLGLLLLWVTRYRGVHRRS